MHRTFVKTAWLIMAMTTLPLAASAQEQEPLPPTDSSIEAQPSKETVEAVPEGQAPQTTSAQTVANEDNAGDPQPLSEQIKAQQSEQNARKDAMRKLSANYGASSSENSKAKAETSPEAAKSLPAAVYIPPVFKNSERLPRFEHHGLFRVRLQYFGNYDLNTRGTSPVPAPLDALQRGKNQQEHIKADDSDAHMGANMRLRYAPSIHISETIRIHSSFDILDNLVLGTTPSGLRQGFGSKNFFNFEGADGSLAKNAFVVKSLYGQADTVLGTFKLGRIPAHWGLGLVYNDGGVFKREEQQLFGHGWRNLDADSHDAIDRIEYQLRDPFLDSAYLSFSWDFVNSGLASYSNTDSLGQAFDLAENDDVLQFTLSLFDRPLSQQAIDERSMRLYQHREWALDWGVLFSYRSQQRAMQADSQSSGDGASSNYPLYEKGAKAYIVDLWGRLYWPLPNEILLRLEAEAVGIFGSVALDLGPNGSKRSINQIGMAFEGEVLWRDLIATLKTGFAWSQNMTYSGHPILDKLAEVPMGSLLRFDPNYRVDQIMFRELMGGINNAWYLNLHGEYKFPLELAQMTLALGASLDLTSSVALKTSATPGDARWYGFEAGAKLFYEESDRFRVELGGGIFVPGQAWQRNPRSSYPMLPSQGVYEDLGTEQFKPDIAWNILANAYFMF